MKTTVKKLSDTRVEIKVVLDKAEMQKAKKQATERLAKEVKVQGFRKGKAPAELAEKHIDPNELVKTTMDIAVRTSVPKAFNDTKHAPLVIPQVNVTKFVPDDTLEYTATADILPEVKLGSYKGLKVKKPETKVPKKDIDEVIENIRNAYAEKTVVKRAAELGDEVKIDFEGTKDGKKFPGGSSKDFPLKLGSGQFIPGFEDGIVGHEFGDRFDLELTFPKDYHAKDLAGQKVNFNVLLKQVTELKKPELDADFAKKCGPFKSMDELKADIEKNLAAQNEAKAAEKYKDDLVGALVEKSTVSAPEVLVKDQIRFIRDDISRNAARQGLTFEDYLSQTGQDEKAWEDSVRPIAEARVKASLVLQVLAGKEKITVSDEIVDAKLAELKEVYKNSKEALKNLKDPNVRQDIKNRLVIEETINFLVQQNSATKKNQ